MAIKPEEKQPQVVTSPDGKVQIINHYPYVYAPFGCYCVQGAVKCISPEPNLIAEIKADCYNIDGELIDTEVETIDFPESVRTTAFHIMYSGRRRLEIKYHKLYITAKKES